MSRIIDTIIIHCSDSNFGNVEVIKEWHLKRGFENIGYHFVINNSYPDYASYKEGKPKFECDGYIETGRNIKEKGAHVKNHNSRSVGICLIGKREFTGKQKESLKYLVRFLRSIYKINEIKGHCEYNKGKTCPNIDMDYLRFLLTT